MPEDSTTCPDATGVPKNVAKEIYITSPEVTGLSNKVNTTGLVVGLACGITTLLLLVFGVFLLKRRRGLTEPDLKGGSLYGLHPAPAMPPEPPLAGTKSSAAQTSYAPSGESSSMQPSSNCCSSADGSPQQDIQVLISADSSASPFAGFCDFSSQDPAALGMQPARPSGSTSSGTPPNSYASQRATTSSSSGRAPTSNESGTDMLAPLPRTGNPNRNG